MSPVLHVDLKATHWCERVGSPAGERALLTISHENDDMAGAVPALRAGVPFPAHHAVHCLEGPLGVSTRLQLVVCGKGRHHHLI